MIDDYAEAARPTGNDDELLRGWRIWFIPTFLLFLLLAPLLREGLPATQQGALPYLQGGVIPYKLMLAFYVIVMALLVGELARRLWGRRLAWWVLSLWLLLPLTSSILYQRGSLEGLWQSQAGLAPFQLFTVAWPSPDNLREWVGGSSVALGWPALILAALAVFVAWPRRAEAAARLVVGLAVGGVILGLLTLLGGPLLLWLLLAQAALLLAAAGLPLLDRRYASLPILVGIVAVAALPLYPTLRPAWLEIPLPLNGGERFGEHFLLLNVQGQHEAGQASVAVHWQLLAPTEEDYTVFVHFLDEQGEIVAQADTLLLDPDQLPSSRWPVGYVVAQLYTAESARPPTQLRLGLYDLDTLQRLPLAGGGDALTLPLR